MNTGCKFDTDIIQKYVEGTIDPLEKIFLEEHIKVCRSCKKELTELKLLFWELENINENEVEVPVEASVAMETVIDGIMASGTSRYGIKDFINSQKKAFEGMGVFIGFIPGSKEGRALVKKAPSSIYRLSGKAFKGSMKLIHSRA